jgi:outer membrane protein TolC
LVEHGSLRGADQVLILAEVEDALAQLNPARTASVTARSDLRRALGLSGQEFDVEGSLETPPLQPDIPQLIELARDRRADLHARQAALAEADANVRLAVANRFGNPNLGPAFEYDPTRIVLMGAQFSVPLPAFNTHRGVILQREAERDRVALEIRQVEVLIAQDVQAAVQRLESAQTWVTTYRTRILPNLRARLADIETLFTQGAAGVDVLRIVEIRRRFLRARDGYLDALWEQSLARADLAAAIGDPALAFPSCPSPSDRETPAPLPVTTPMGPDR